MALAQRYNKVVFYWKKYYINQKVFLKVHIFNRIIKLTTLRFKWEGERSRNSPSTQDSDMSKRPTRI